ncbi:response regulator UvrY [bacterium BMS3Abin07]|nr:response regulator UvrY [bacterium BMS3Abin07]GBE32042.1 response regulator UvrY [bacterium BMS3Bbin05]HDO21287.1 response regulator transcription factor [Nitrospirota bacterium]HDZ88445.1 response regulator transcription factor [Nitrospirota bacterium]
MVKILIADDHTIVREGLRQILLDSGLSDIDEAGKADEIINKVRNNSYDLILLDISMPGRSGLDVLKQIRCEGFDMPILILTMHPEGQYAIRALRAGASGYLTKESAPDELIAAIKKVSRGGKYISQSLAEEIAYALDDTSDRPLHTVLSDREYQVLCMIASGKTLTHISDYLALSVKTISTYRSRVLNKMRMQNNAELTHYAIKNGLVE